MLRRFTTTHEFRLLLAAIGLTIALAFGSPRFLSVQNLLDLLTNTAFIGMLASGLLVVLVAGSIDISFTAVASVAQYVSIVVAIHAGLGLLSTVLIAAVVGAALGMVNAYLVFVLR